MKPIFLFILTALLCYDAGAQIITRYQTISTPYQWRNGRYDSTLRIPFGSVPTLREKGSETVPGALFYSTTDSTTYVWTGHQWIPSSTSSTIKTVADTTARNAIAAEDRYEGMLVYVTDVQKYYSLKGGILNSNWTELAQGETTIISTGSGVFIDNF